MNALKHVATPSQIVLNDFRAYLENSLKDPFILNLKDASLMEVIDACIGVKCKMHPHYGDSLGGLIHNLRILQDHFRVILQPVQVTDIFWGYFISFCEQRGLRPSSIDTMCHQLRSVLNWAMKYNAPVSPSFADIDFKPVKSLEIALTADEVSRITYFDIDRFYAGRRLDFRRTMHRVRDMFVLSANLFQRHSDMVRIEPANFERNIFRITQQKTGNLAEVNIDRYSIEPKTTYRLLEEYGHKAPYAATIGNYNYYLHPLMRDIGLTDPVRIEERRRGILQVSTVPKWRMITSHTARRTAITVGVLRGHNIHALRRCSGHSDLSSLDRYIWDE